MQVLNRSNVSLHMCYTTDMTKYVAWEVEGKPYTKKTLNKTWVRRQFYLVTEEKNGLIIKIHLPLHVFLVCSVPNRTQKGLIKSMHQKRAVKTTELILKSLKRTARRIKLWKRIDRCIKQSKRATKHGTLSNWHKVNIIKVIIWCLSTTLRF